MVRTVISLLALAQVLGCHLISGTKTSDRGGPNGTLPPANFLPIPLDCPRNMSVNSPCDGFWMRNSSEGHLPVFPENRSSNWPTSEGLHLISGPFDPNKPTVIFLHGWMGKVPERTTVGFPDSWRDQARAAGFNVALFHWHNHSWDSAIGCPGLASVGDVNNPCHASMATFESGGASDFFLREYAASGFFRPGYAQEVRLVGHSLGAQLAIIVAYRMFHHPEFARLAKPQRIDLIDPALNLNVGLSRREPFDGQIPEAHRMPEDLRNSITSEFPEGSPCRPSATRPYANPASQYCQLEGMSFALVRQHRVAMLNLASIVAGLTARDLHRTMVHQAFAGNAFEGNSASRHGTPMVSYWFSFAPGTPSGGWDASSDTRALLEASLRQANGENLSLIQTAGLNTISLNDDEFRPRQW